MAFEFVKEGVVKMGLSLKRESILIKKGQFLLYL